MTDTRSSEKTSYKEARSAFEQLETKDKVAFVLEATFGMLGRAAEEGGRALSDMLNDLAAEAKRRRAETEEASPGGDGAAEESPSASAEPPPGDTANPEG